MSKIEWTDKTWNPIIGCSHVSPACDHCYAERTAFRLSHNPKAPIEYRNVVTDSGTWNGKTALVESVIEKPLHWSKPCRVFVGSMTDLFHEDTPFEWIDRVFAVMALSPRITFQVLTKRPGRMQEYLYRRNGTAVKVRRKAEIIGRNLPDNHPGLSVTNWRKNGMNQVHAIWPLPNVWLGVTVENQEQADKRIPILLDTSAAVRFVSVEPMLGPVDLRHYFPDSFECALTCGKRLAEHPGIDRCVKCGFEGEEGSEVWGDGDCEECPECGGCETEPVCPDCGTYMVQYHPDTQYLDWVIVGGETGPSARPMRPNWARLLRDQCLTAKVPFFFKHWGATRHTLYQRQIDGKRWEQFPRLWRVVG